VNCYRELEGFAPIGVLEQRSMGVMGLEGQKNGFFGFHYLLLPYTLADFGTFDSTLSLPLDGMNR